MEDRRQGRFSNLFDIIFTVYCFQVIQIDPDTSKLLQTVTLPVTLVTSAVWGGENWETLYVTTSRHGLTDEDLALQPLAGSTFRITGLGVIGTLANNARLPPI